ncbi:MAG: VWA domain-containing protein [Planctomycetes bacterium]|nr:VWA domain-containing protein [Planctomycetota bacterium]
MNLGELFLAPECAWLFSLLPLAAWLERLAARRRARALREAFDERAERIAEGAAPKGARLRRGAGYAAVALAITAAMQPTFGPPERESTPRGSDVAICLDVSQSMLARDLEPSRLAAAKRAIEALCVEAKADRCALILFAGAAVLRAPLTADLEAIADLAREAHPTDVPRGGTDLGAALALAQQTLEASRENARAVVVLSDGEDPAGSGRAPARALAERGVAVHAVGLGSERGAKIAIGSGAEQSFLRDAQGRDVITRLDPRGLEALAEAGGGRYASGDAEGAALVALHREAIAPHAEERDAAAARERRASRATLPLLAALLLGILLLARPARREAPHSQ